MPSPRPTSRQRVKQTVDDLAAKGSRALGVARSEDAGHTWSLLGILPMFDPPRDDSKAHHRAWPKQRACEVKMVTGDDTAIAIETARQLGMGTHIIPAADVFPKDMDPNNVPPAIADAIERADGFARVFPEHKYAIVKALQARGHLVAMTGDGVNDAPALKQADCGTAVSGATDAARSAAALVLTAPGLSVIDNAIDEARRIFGRITSYTIYRVALTMDIMFLVVMSTVFLDFAPLTAVMIVIMSLLDDVPIMTIAYDNTAVSAEADPLADAAAARRLGRARAVLDRRVVRPAVDRHPGAVPSALQEHFGLTSEASAADRDVPAARRRRPSAAVHHPQRALVLPAAIPGARCCSSRSSLTQVVAVLMCGFGWLVPPIPWTVIGWVWAYNIAWMFVLGAVRLIAEKLRDLSHRAPGEERAHRESIARSAGRGRDRRNRAWITRRSSWSSPARKVRLSKIDPSYTGKHESHEEAAPQIAKHRRAHGEAAVPALCRRRPIAPRRAPGARCRRQGRRGPARVQRHESAGDSVFGFKQPSTEELAHDFLWRVHLRTPAKGEIVIFNRSHYEDVLVVRVHKLVPQSVWSKRYNLINEFEKLLAAEWHAHPEVLPPHQPRGAARALRPAARRSGAQLEDQRERLCRARAVAEIRRGLRGCHGADEHEARALVRHPGEPQMVPQPRGVADHRRHDGGYGLEVPPTQVDIADIRRKYHAAARDAEEGAAKRRRRTSS